MKKIKPEVLGYVRQYKAGDFGKVLFLSDELKSVCLSLLSAGLGKPKFRPVYKKDIS